LMLVSQVGLLTTSTTVKNALSRGQSRCMPAGLKQRVFLGAVILDVWG
jgi:hypothetical protein